ncbi:MAG TPA: TonB-dependent receptor [Thermoanaerobaculia bacterium]|nr:TonB-dependent receptor [Thermoanaerobaculia bacterium]
MPRAAHGAAATGSIAGKVIDAHGAAVSGAMVELVDLRRRTLSDAEGGFRFDTVPAGNHLLSAESARVGTAAANVTVTAGDEAHLEIALDVAVHKEEIVVSAGPEARSAGETYQPAQVVDSSELQSLMQPTLGETLGHQPGVSSTEFGQGASRPVIRGQGGDRVRILDNGVGSGDVSDTSPDHAVSSDPFSADRVEILRGPATLMYGSSAEGGVVNVISNRIPRLPANEPLSGRADLRYGSNANERSGSLNLDGGGGAFAYHLDGFKRDTDDYESGAGKVANSALTAKGGSAGGSWVGENGFLGVSATRFDTTYGNPAEPDAQVHIDLTQKRYDLQGEYDGGLGFLKSLRTRIGRNHYNHAEIEGGELGTLFIDRGWEGRVEAVQQSFGNVNGSFGVQWKRRDFSAIGEESFVEPNHTDTWAGFLFEEIGSGSLRAQLGLRHESQDTKIDSVELPDRTFGATSGSLGGIWTTGNYAVALTGSRSVKLPNAEELYANGVHAATEAFEIGDPNLQAEKSTGLDLSLRKTSGRARGEVSVFASNTNGYIFEELTDEVFPRDEGDLAIVRFRQHDAKFRGAEVHLDYELVHSDPHHLVAELTGDYVHAELSDTGEPLPRIPPKRYGAALRYQHPRWGAAIEGYRVSRQDRIGAFETSTPGYTFLNAELSYRLFGERLVHDLVLRGTNLTDELALNHVSFLKDVAPLPGRNVTLSYRLGF